MKNNNQEIESPKKNARIAGFFYLILAITAFFTLFVDKKLVISGDAVITANNILNSMSLFNLGIVSELIMAVFWILTAFMLYKLFKPINKNNALLMFSLVLVGGAIACINTLNKIVAIIILNGNYLRVFEASQLESLTMLFLNLYQNGVVINHIFFGLWLVPLGLLIIKSRYFPKIISRIIGILLLVAGIGYLADVFIFFFLPSFNIRITDYTFWGELILLLWLLIKGVKPNIKS